MEAVEPEPGEDAALAAEEARLGYADELRTAAEQAREALSSDQEQPDALATTSAARTLLDGVRDHDPEAGELADRLAEISYLLSDVAADVASYASRLETDPARLATVSERRAALTALTRKYGETIDEVLDWAEQSATRLLELDNTDERIEELRTERADLREQLGAAAAALSAARTSAAARLTDEVTAELTLLAMPDARIEVTVTQSEVPDDHDGVREPLLVDGRRLRFTATGVDEVELLLAANTGSEPRPLHKGASGGELSRVMLALEVSLAGTSPVPDVRLRRGRRRGRRPRRGRDRAPAGPAGAGRPGAGRHPPAPGRGVRRPPRGRREVQRRLGHHLRADGPRSGATARRSCRGCSPAWTSPTPPWRTPASCSTPHSPPAPSADPFPGRRRSDAPGPRGCRFGPGPADRIVRS